MVITTLFYLFTFSAIVSTRYIFGIVLVSESREENKKK